MKLRWMPCCPCWALGEELITLLPLQRCLLYMSMIRCMAHWAVLQMRCKERRVGLQSAADAEAGRLRGGVIWGLCWAPGTGPLLQHRGVSSLENSVQSKVVTTAQVSGALGFMISGREVYMGMTMWHAHLASSRCKGLQQPLHTLKGTPLAVTAGPVLRADAGIHLLQARSADGPAMPGYWATRAKCWEGGCLHFTPNSLPPDCKHSPAAAQLEAPPCAGALLTECTEADACPCHAGARLPQPTAAPLPSPSASR